jgi:hypothetical protein
LAASVGNKINLLVCHHPPGVHGEHDLGEYDFIHNGDGLLRCLEHHGAWLVVHGHKHHGRISYAQGSNAAPIIFSASSLGFCLDVAKPGVRNQFYILDLTQRESGGVSEARPVLLPFGPRIFFAISLLVAMAVEEAAVWHVDGDDDNSVDAQQPTGHAVILSCLISSQ